MNDVLWTGSFRIHVAGCFNSLFKYLLIPTFGRKWGGDMWGLRDGICGVLKNRRIIQGGWWYCFLIVITEKDRRETFIDIARKVQTQQGGFNRSWSITNLKFHRDEAQRFSSRKDSVHEQSYVNSTMEKRGGAIWFYASLSSECNDIAR